MLGESSVTFYYASKQFVFSLSWKTNMDNKLSRKPTKGFQRFLLNILHLLWPMKYTSPLSAAIFLQPFGLLPSISCNLNLHHLFTCHFSDHVSSYNVSCPVGYYQRHIGLYIHDVLPLRTTCRPLSEGQKHILAIYNSVAWLTLSFFISRLECSFETAVELAAFSLQGKDHRQILANSVWGHLDHFVSHVLFSSQSSRVYCVQYVETLQACVAD